MSKLPFALAIGLGANVVAGAPARAHGPLFSPAPETIFKGGTEVTLGFHTEKATGAGEVEKEYEAFVEAEYGLTADWEIGIEVPYAWKKSNGLDANGLGDIVLDTKYQFWRRASGRTGTLNGSFFSGPVDQTRFLGGQFGITGPDYQASGTIATAKQ